MRFWLCRLMNHGNSRTMQQTPLLSHPHDEITSAIFLHLNTSHSQSLFLSLLLASPFSLDVTNAIKNRITEVECRNKTKIWKRSQMGGMLKKTVKLDRTKG
jgi:hypothetical protein